MNKSDQIRDYVARTYVKPARQLGQAEVRVVAGEVERALGLISRAPMVCSALRSQKLLTRCHLELKRAEGPPSGQSTTMTYTYRLLDAPGAKDELPGMEANKNTPASNSPGMLAYRGALRDFYRAEGGGERVLREERAAWGEADQERESAFEKIQQEPEARNRASRLEEDKASPASDSLTLLDFYGALSDLYRAEGGSERVLREERAAWGEDSEGNPRK